MIASNHGASHTMKFTIRKGTSESVSIKMYLLLDWKEHQESSLIHLHSHRDTEQLMNNACLYEKRFSERYGRYNRISHCNGVDSKFEFQSLSIAQSLLVIPNVVASIVFTGVVVPLMIEWWFSHKVSPLPWVVTNLFLYPRIRCEVKIAKVAE